MFLSSFEKLRKKIQLNDIVNMAHLGPRAFEEIGGEVVQTTSFVLRRSYIEKYKGTYCRLIEPTTQQGKEKMFLGCENRYCVEENNFSKIPGSPVAYWVSNSFIKFFDEKYAFKNIANAKAGLSTTDNNKFLRMWYETDFSHIGFNYSSLEETKDCKFYFIPEPKGGSFRKWYGNLDYVVDWYDNGKHIRKAAEGASGGRIVGSEYYFRQGLTWSDITSGGNLSVRYMPAGMIFNSSAPSCFCMNDEWLFYLMAFMNSPIAKEYLKYLAPSYHFNAGPIEKLPVIIDKSKKEKITEIVKNAVDLSKKDWDCFETSWDFHNHPLPRKVSTIAEAFGQWQTECDDRFNQLKGNEEELNRIFINIYGLQDELTPEVGDKDVTARKADLFRDIRSFISYAVGCMFGRYSLDEEGLIYAGGKWDSSLYKTFIPDNDNCIPITDEEYFSDGIVSRFVEFVKTVYGADTLEENLDFIANALGNKGDTSREVIRNYFQKDFYADHLKVYQKRPIYWLFDSGKQNGFKALIYMHRYDADTVGRVRTDYLHRAQKYVETAMQSAQYTIDNASSASEKSKATKAVTKYTKQLAEMKIYDEAIAHIANKRIEIDLDDGVKVNYAKFQGVEVAQEGKKALKVDLLAKIK